MYITIGLWVLILFFISAAILNLWVFNAYNNATSAWMRGDNVAGRKWQETGQLREMVAHRHPFNRWMEKRDSGNS